MDGLAIGAVFAAIAAACWGMWRTRSRGAAFPPSFVDTPIARIDSLTHRQRVRVVGTIRGDVFAPITGRACALWVVFVEAPSAGARGVIVSHHQSQQPVTITDASGDVLVDVAGATLYITGRAAMGDARGAPPEIRTALQSLAPSWPDPDDLAYREHILCDGDRVAIVGHAVAETVPVTAPDYRDNARRTVHHFPEASITDNPRALR